MTLSPSKIKYLLAIHEVSPNLRPFKSIDVAKFLKISRSSVNNMLDDMIKDKLVLKDFYGKANLTESGKEMAKTIYKNYKNILRFFVTRLHMDGKRAKEEATNLICNLSDETVDELINFLNKEKHLILTI